MKAIINIDSIQFFIYIFGGLFSIFYILYHRDINFISSFYNFLNQDIIKTQISSKGIIFDSYFFVNAFIGGTLLSLCSHGVDYMMVQRALCTKDLKSAQKSIIGSGFLVFAQFLIFLFVGFLLAKFYTNSGVVFEKDREFAHFIISDLPVGIKGILIAGVFSAAMSTLSSSINSLTSSTFIDFNIRFDNTKKILIGLFWSVALTSIALIFDESNEALIITGIKIASFTYGILLTYFILLKLGYSSEVVMHVAVASSLGVICFTSLSSIRSHIKLKNTNLNIVKKWALGIVLGSIFGSLSASFISGENLVLALERTRKTRSRYTQ